MNQFEHSQEILKFWKETDAFKKSVEERSTSMMWKFFDGPPFTSWDPHYGHLLQSTVKDMIPRWMTMRGYRVPRVRWRDCHGIPAENFVNKKLWITSKKQVEEEFWLQEYVEECRTMVNQVNDNRTWFVDNLGRWVDMESAYFTMNNDYMESVVHLFSDLYHKNLIYKGFKVLWYSWALWTALSNSEIAEWYRDRQDPAVTVRMTIKDEIKDVAVWIIKKDEKFLMVYDIRSGKRFMPWGKKEWDESIYDATKRELAEEIGITIEESKHVWWVKVAHHGTLRQLQYVKIEKYSWEFVNLEPEKQGAIARVTCTEDEEGKKEVRVEVIGEESANVITDQDQIAHDFADLMIVHYKKYENQDMMDAPFNLFAWTTTPWTLPSNMFGAVNKEVTYAIVFDKENKEYVVMSNQLVEKYFKDAERYMHLFDMTWDHFVGLSYKPFFDYYYMSPNIDNEYHDQVHKILHADFVTGDSGTGIAHEAPAFWEDDYYLVTSILPKDEAKKWLFNPVNDHGEFTQEVSDFAGMNVIEANKSVIEALKKSWVLAKHETIQHSYPHCPRTKTPLIYRAQESWFVKEDELKAKTVPLTDEINFVPKSIKNRFVNGLESAPDWNVSRSRFRGAPLPIWENEEGTVRQVPGSLQDIFQLNRKQKQLTKVILIRNGETDFEQSWTYDCVLWNEAKLTAWGKDQAEKISKELEQVHVDHIYASPLYTCIDTVSPLWLLKGLVTHTSDELRNPDCQNLQGKEAQYSASCETWASEKRDDVRKRVVTFFNELVQKHAGETVVIAADREVLFLMRKYIYSWGHNKKDFMLTIDNTQPDSLPYEIEVVQADSWLVLDLHRPYIDKIKLNDPENGEELVRIPDVLDCWFESGSMPYGQDHYMKNAAEPVGSFSTTADFIAEGLDQTRWRFRSLHVLWAAYTDNIIYKNVVVTWMILAEDGKKMSKSEKNYPDPKWLLTQYGADAFRLYVLWSPVVRSEPLRFSEKWVEQVLKDFVIPLQNVRNFFKTYAEVDNRIAPKWELYFMRHAKKATDEYNEDASIALSEEGRASLEEQSFKEKVIRINPQVIYTSPSPRWVETAAWVQKVLKEAYWKDIEIREDERLLVTNADGIWYFLQEMEGNEERVLCVTHQPCIAAAMEYILWHAATRATYNQVVKLPAIKISSELDQWIIWELAKTINEVDENLEAYHIEGATKDLQNLMEKVTNRWLRRSRRRFWAEWVSEDKKAVYRTLREIILNYLKLAAPFAPFVTEGIYQEMKSFALHMQKEDSIHRTFRPLWWDMYKNEALSEEITQVRKIIKWAMYLRAKHQTKVKQPLKELKFSF